jgi:hypothetical protein
VTFAFFIINARTEIYFNVCIAFLDVVHYKTLQHKVRYLIVGHHPHGRLDALSISPFLVIDDKHLEFFNN